MARPETLREAVAGGQVVVQDVTAAVTAPLRVLVVDDNPDDVVCFQRLVRSLDWQVVSAGTAAGCLEAVHAAGPDIIVLDYNLGDGYGTDVLLRLRESGIQTPTIVQSGLPGALQAMGGLPPSAVGFVSKNSPDYHREIIDLIRATASQGAKALHPQAEFPAESWATIDEILRSLVDQEQPKFACAGFARSRNLVTSAQCAIAGTALVADLEGLGRLGKAAPRLALALEEAKARSAVIDFEGSTVCLAPIGGLGTLFASCREPGAAPGPRERFEAAIVALTSLKVTTPKDARFRRL